MCVDEGEEDGAKGKIGREEQRERGEGERDEVIHYKKKGDNQEGQTDTQIEDMRNKRKRKRDR